MLLELSLSVERSRESLGATIGRDPTLDDLAEHLGRPPAKIAEALRAVECRRTHAFEVDVLEDASGAAFVEQAEARATLESLTPILDRRAREVLRLRFFDDLVQSEIAARLGCSQIQVSRIIRSSLEQLRL